MKHLKIYEHYDSKELPKEGDYVVLNPEELGKELEFRIGKIQHLKYSKYGAIYYYVYYDDGKWTSNDITKIENKPYNVCFDVDNNQSLAIVPMEELILAWSSDKEKMEMFIQANKYNI